MLAQRAGLAVERERDDLALLLHALSARVDDVELGMAAPGVECRGIGNFSRGSRPHCSLPSWALGGWWESELREGSRLWHYPDGTSNELAREKAGLWITPSPVIERSVRLPSEMFRR